MLFKEGKLSLPLMSSEIWNSHTLIEMLNTHHTHAHADTHQLISLEAAASPKLYYTNAQTD